MDSYKVRSTGLGQKGFTLIEFLIALVIIGFIVTLLVNFFSNPLKDASLNKAVTKITDDMRTYADAEQKFYADHTRDITDIDELTTVVAPAASQVLTYHPTPPSNAMNTGFTEADYKYTLDAATYTQWGTGTADLVIVLDGINDAVCDRINKDAGLGAAIATPVGTAGLQCIGVAAPHKAVKPISIN